jgi:hypothetical protein
VTYQKYQSLQEKTMQTSMTEWLKWSIPANARMQKENLTLKHGFIVNTYQEIAVILESSLATFPKQLQSNFPDALAMQLPDDWYITGKIYTHTNVIYLEKHGNALAISEDMDSTLKCISAGKFLGDDLYATVLQTKNDKTIAAITRLLPESRIVTYQNKNIILYTDSSREDILVPELKWCKRLFLSKFGIKVNIGKEDHPADAVWWINNRQGDIVDNIIDSAEGKWQLLPGKGLSVINNLSLKDVLEKIHKI